MKTLLAVLLLVATATLRAAAPNAAELEKMAARFVPTEISADLSQLSPNDRKVLAKLVEASQIIDGIFLRQMWTGNPAMLLQLAADESTEGRARLRNFVIEKGPWSSLDQNKPFIPGAPPKPEGAGFYPPDATKAEIEAWIKSLPPNEQARAKGFFTVVRRKPDRSFLLVDYSTEYGGELTRAAQLLREAAAATGEPTLKKFLKTRADAFLSNDYYPSDVAWM
ncbi:MAG: dipeptidyl-peptidase 3 family protein, partial [Chthoniobacterales bacterium]